MRRGQTIFRLFAPSQSLGRLVRQAEVAHPPGLGTNRRTCHPHADNTPVATLDSPLQVACTLALNTKAEDAKRQRWHQGARSGAYQAGWRGELAGGGAPEVRAGPRRSAPCRPRTAAVVAADGAAGVPCAFASWVRLARS